MKNNTTNFKTFNYHENGEVSASLLSTLKTTSQLDPGLYSIETAFNSGRGWEAKISILEGIETYDINIKYHFLDKINTIFKAFFNSEIKEKVNKLGYKHKAGILLHGKQGTGKTSIFKSYFNEFITKQNAIVFSIDSTQYMPLMWDYIQQIRKIQTNPIIIFIDECEILCSNEEEVMKKALDGFDSIDNCVILMATNYINKIPEAIKSRPSRIKYKFEVEGIQDEEVIYNFVHTSFNKVEVDLSFTMEEAKAIQGCTVDDLKQMVLDKIMSIEPSKTSKTKLGF